MDATKIVLLFMMLMVNIKTERKQAHVGIRYMLRKFGNMVAGE
jgi:hypothetical protein